jgi:F0F1-type ATP synthase assembly protein I
MPDPDHLALGNDAPSGPADDAPGAPVADDAEAKLLRAVVATAAGTTVNPLERSSYAKATNAGYSNAMGRGLELTLTLAIMVGLGWFIDHQAGTAPLFIIVLSVIGFAGTAVKLKLAYDLEMREHTDGAVWNRGAS